MDVKERQTQNGMDALMKFSLQLNFEKEGLASKPVWPLTAGGTRRPLHIYRAFFFPFSYKLAGLKAKLPLMTILWVFSRSR